MEHPVFLVSPAGQDPADLRAVHHVGVGVRHEEHVGVNLHEHVATARRGAKSGLTVCRRTRFCHLAVSTRIDGIRQRSEASIEAEEAADEQPD